MASVVVPRFLAENGLLLHPQFRAPVSLGECEELAAELGEPDGWSVAARFAAEIFRGSFAVDDPCVAMRLAPEGRQRWSDWWTRLPAEVFTAEDALGWVYQFWQQGEGRGQRVGAQDRWCGSGPGDAVVHRELHGAVLVGELPGGVVGGRHPESPLLKGFEYLRFDEDGTPAAGVVRGVAGARR